MPRSEKLCNLTPNRVYSVEGTLVSKHQSETFTTAILQQESVQKKIKIPSCETEIKEGNNYKFKNCFYNSSGWLTVKKPEESIEVVSHLESEPENIKHFYALSEIKQSLEELGSSYFSTHLFVLSKSAKTVTNRNGKENSIETLKCYSENCLVDVTVWNNEVEQPEEILNKWITLESIRVKKLVGSKFVIVSSVFSNISICQREFKDIFDQNKVQDYEKLSEIYEKRHLSQLSEMGLPKEKVFSVIKAKVKSIVKADYQGCPKCKRKIEGACAFCNLSLERTFEYGKVILEQDGSEIEAIVFDEKIIGLFKYAKEGVSVEGKIKTFSREEDGETLISHILTSVDSIFF